MTGESQKQHQSKTATLLGLPAELRNQIYELALRQREIIEIEESIGNNPVNLKEPALLAVCRKARGECVSLYYSNNTFHCRRISTTISFLTQLEDQRVALLMHLRPWESAADMTMTADLIDRLQERMKDGGCARSLRAEAIFIPYGKFAAISLRHFGRLQELEKKRLQSVEYGRQIQQTGNGAIDLAVELMHLSKIQDRRPGYLSHAWSLQEQIFEARLKLVRGGHPWSSE